jgi:hypothetical protein
VSLGESRLGESSLRDRRERSYKSYNKYRSKPTMALFRFLLTVLSILLQTQVYSLNLKTDGCTRRAWCRATAGFFSSTIAYDAAANALTLGVSKPHLMEEYYNNKPATNAAAGRAFFPALTPPFRERATYRYEVS